MENLNLELAMNQESFRLLRDFIYDKSGIFFADNKQAQLETRLAQRLKANNISEFEQYYDLLKYDDPASDELRNLFDSVSTNETSFFRSPPQVEAFQKKVLPDILAAQSDSKTLRIWSAGCSTGEEPYTLSIIISEALGAALSDWDIRIVGSDLSPKALRSAEQAVYSEYALRGVSQEIRERYFTPQGVGYSLAESVKKLVAFEHLNLSQTEAIETGDGYDAIFCRNVLIYFDDELKRRVVSKLYDSLKPGGYLIIGHSESLHNISRAFKLVHFTGALGYRKE